MQTVTIDLDQVRQDIAQKEQVVSQAQRELDDLRAVERYLESQNGSSRGAGSVGAVGRIAGASLAGMTLHDAVAQVMREHGKPMRVGEIVDVLQAANYGTHLKHPRNAVYTALNRKENLFKKLGTGLWGVLKGGE